MAVFMMDMPPALSGGNPDAVQLRQYVARLVDRLLYTLNHLDSENLTDGGVSIGKIEGGGSAIAQAAVAEIGMANLGRTAVEHLTAQVAEIVTGVIHTAVIDWANLRHMVGETAIISRFVGEDMYIDHLAVTAAQAVELWAGTLCIKAADGIFYKLNVDLDTGLVTAEAVTITQEEFDAGITSGGQHIIESSMTVEELQASSISAVEALINRIIATRIDVDELFAREATIGKLTTGAIASALGQSLNLSSNQSIQSTVRTISEEGDQQVLTQVNQIRQTANAASVSVQDLENRLGTHFIVQNDRIRITQDQNQNWEMQLTATDMAFLNRATNAVAAKFGIAGGYADRLQSYKKLCVGTESHGWYDMTERAGSVDDKWRGTSANAATIITQQPQDAVVDVGDTTFTLSVTAENASGYQWQERIRSESGTWSDASGCTSATMTGIVSESTLGKEFRCMVGSVPSEAVRVRVKDAPVILLEKVSGQTITVTAAGTVSSWTWEEWQSSAWAGISGATTNSYTASGAGDYRCIAEDASGRQAVSRVFTIE